MSAFSRHSQNGFINLSEKLCSRLTQLKSQCRPGLEDHDTAATLIIQDLLILDQGQFERITYYVLDRQVLPTGSALCEVLDTPFMGEVWQWLAEHTMTHGLDPAPTDRAECFLAAAVVYIAEQPDTRLSAQLAVHHARAVVDALECFRTAEAKAIQIKAQAVTQQGGKDYVQLQAIEKWDGKLPTQMVPGATVPFINLTR